MLSSPKPSASLHRGILFACRSRIARIAPRPVPFGGLRMPSNKSFKHHGVIVLLVLRRKQERQRLPLIGQPVEFVERLFGF